MAYRSQKAGCTAILVAISAITPLLGQQELRFDVRHDHWRGSGAATLVVGEQTISFQEQNKKGEVRHTGEWRYSDIQELKVSPETLTVVTYKDRKWRLGADQEFKFSLAPGPTFEAVYPLLKDRLDQRFVAALSEQPALTLWEVPVKRLGTIRGSEGVLRVASDRIVYSTDQEGQSRTWRYQDIDNISTSGPFELTVTTFERSQRHYGSRKAFNFQLKQPLEEAKFDHLWRRLNRSRGLDFLTSLEAGEPQR